MVNHKPVLKQKVSVIGELPPYQTIDLGINNVHAISTYRYKSDGRLFNLAAHSGDTRFSFQNRQWLKDHLQLDSDVITLKQVHHNTVHQFDAAEVQTQVKADAATTRQAGQPCGVLSADCLPLLISDHQGDQIASVHAGWRGLLAGVIQNTLQCFSDKPLIIWMGPGISQPYFEVGKEVYDAFVGQGNDFKAYFEPQNAEKYLMDLKGLAYSVIRQYNVIKIIDDSRCTYACPDEFFSYRRDGPAGCMASIIWKE